MVTPLAQPLAHNNIHILSGNVSDPGSGLLMASFVPPEPIRDLPGTGPRPSSRVPSPPERLPPPTTAVHGRARMPGA